MRLSTLHAPVRRDPPRDADCSHLQLLVRAGYVRGLGAGVFGHLPLGARTLERLGALMRQEWARLDLVVLDLGRPGDEVSAAAVALYQRLAASGIAGLLDDTADRAGVEFSRADLAGYPFQTVVGSRGLARAEVEWEDRRTGARVPVAVEDVVRHARAAIEEDTRR